MNEEKTMNDRKAVSEVIGYVIILGIVFTSIGIVYSNAIPALDESQTAQQLENVERSFSVLQNNMDEIVENKVPRKSTEMRLTSGTLNINTGVTEGGREQTLNITVAEEPSFSNIIYEDSGFVSPVAYSIGQKSVIYENGAVLRSDQGTAGMINDPGWVIEDDKIVISSIRTVYGAGTIGAKKKAGTSTTGLIRSEYTGINQARNIQDCDPSTGGNQNCTVNVTVTTDHSTAWLQYFREISGKRSDITVSRLNDERVEMIIEEVPRIVYSRTNVQLGIN